MPTEEGVGCVEEGTFSHDYIMNVGLYCVFVCWQVGGYVRVSMYVYVYIYIYIYIYIYMYM